MKDPMKSISFVRKKVPRWGGSWWGGVWFVGHKIHRVWAGVGSFMKYIGWCGVGGSWWVDGGGVGHEIHRVDGMGWGEDDRRGVGVGLGVM